MAEAQLARPDQEGFHSRADAVFGALDTASGAAPSWSLTKQIVYRAGRAEAYSSDEEQEAEANEQARQEVTGQGLVRFGDGELQEIVKPSEAFCGAIDREDEFDAQDAVALAAGEPAGEAAANEQASAGQLEDLPGLSGDATSSSKKQRVLAAEGTRDKHTGQELVQRHPAAASRVPDHVRNPGSYTCYTLDEPIWVGGVAGDLKPQDPWQAAQESSTAPNNSATEAAEANAQPDFREPDGNEPMTQQPLYQPRQRKQGLATAAAGAALVRASGPLALVSDLADDADGLDMDVDQAPPAAAPQTATRRAERSIRRKPLDDS